jgi:cytochrome c-type biogenesis protein CcmF
LKKKLKIKKERELNYSATVGVFDISYDNKKISTLMAEKRHYQVKNSVMTEAGIDPGIFRDLYVSMGESLSSNAWAVRIHVKPYVRWIWAGAIFMAFGGLLSLLDKRYRSRKERKLNRKKV